MVEWCYFAYILWMWIKRPYLSLKNKFQNDFKYPWLSGEGYQKWWVSMIMYLVNSFTAGWFSDSFHKCSLNTYCISALFYTFLLESMDLLCSLFPHHWKKQTLLLPWHQIMEVQSSLSLHWGIIITQKLKIISKALLCVCKHKAARHLIRVGSEHSEREKALRQQLLLPISPRHTLNKACCSVVVSYISQWCLCQGTFLIKWKKESKGKCSVEKRVQMYIICLQIFQARSSSYRLWTFSSSSCLVQTETHWRSAGFMFMQYPSELTE